MKVRSRVYKITANWKLRPKITEAICMSGVTRPLIGSGDQALMTSSGQGEGEEKVCWVSLETVLSLQLFVL